MTEPVHVVGASGRTGAALCDALQAAGTPVIPVVRNLARYAATGLAAPPRLADLDDAVSLREALADATRIVLTAHARNTAALIAVAPAAARIVLLGSTRKFTRWPDAHGRGVLAGEAAWLASGRNGVMLHPTMIYGATGENNVRRLAALLARLPLVPLPGGGGALVQPIHQADLTAAILAALRIEWHGPQTLVVAGPTPLPYRDFVRAVAKAAGLEPPRVVSLPAAPLRLLAPLSRLLPGLPTIGADEIRRLTENKAVDANGLAQLGISPRPLTQGLDETFGPETSAYGVSTRDFATPP